METMAERLQELMKEHGHSYQALADRMGVSKGTVRNWVKGQEIKPHQIERLAKLYRVSKLWLRDGIEKPMPDEDLLLSVIRAVETAIADSGAAISPEKRAALYTELYAYSAGTGRVDIDFARRIVRLAA